MTNALIIKARGVIFFLCPEYMSVKEFLNSSISVISASSWFVTCGMLLHELTKWGAAILLILGISLTSTSPNSEWEYWIWIFFSVFSCWILLGLLIFIAANFFISLSTTLPNLSEPLISETSIPNSRANFLALGLANLILPGFFSSILISLISGCEIVSEING